MCTGSYLKVSARPRRAYSAGRDPGQICSAINANAVEPRRDQESMSGNVCRCGAYNRDRCVPTNPDKVLHRLTDLEAEPRDRAAG
ncbi:hypothetical protein GKO32_23325 [Amycolatopsis sp. RM579]|uniref:Uncharacterized protein n=1 Tax=Amycolatopsis pithecellobii TaxID=664692 RepID=A0A6N7YY97_9PSEU|nr:hypothetical protein [Amycolatopsis pithecellobii]